MSDVDGGAPAPAEAPAAPATQVPVDPPESAPRPVSDAPQTTPEAPKPEPKPVTTREAIQKATEKVERDAKEAEKPAEKAPAKAEPKQEGPARGEDGKFAPKEGAKAEPDPGQTRPEVAKSGQNDLATPAHEPPARFNAEAKAAWAEAPEPVKAEVLRAHREMEQGIEKYRTAAAEREELQEFYDLAKRGNTTVKAAMTNYVQLEQLLGQNILGGLDAIAKRYGTDLRQVAAHIMGQAPEQVADQRDATIRSLEQTVRQLQQQVGTVAGTMQQQHMQGVEQQVASFKADKPRFDELEPQITKLITTGMVDVKALGPERALAEAYQMAERLVPAPQAPAPAPAAPVVDLAAQTRKGSLSISGAPSPGSNPAAKPPASSTREALQRAFQAASG